MARRGDGSVNGGLPYRTMKQDEINIPRAPRYWPTYVGIAIVWALAGAGVDHHYSKTRTVTVTKEVEKVVTTVVRAPPPACVDRLFVLENYKRVDCDNSDHVLQYKPGEPAAVCRCKSKE